MFLTLAFLFFIGSTMGWGLEVLYRRLAGHRWVNPGFLTGPYLPLYGFSLVVLYLLASLEAYIHIEAAWLRKILLFVVMAAAITIVEYIAGRIFIVRMKIQLWDYSDRFGNIQGIICPQFSFYWMVLSALYYFLIHPRILDALAWLSANLAFSFVIGFFFGVFTLDLAYSTRLMVKIKRFAEETQIVVRLDELREDIQMAFAKHQVQMRRPFVFSLRTNVPLRDMLENYRAAHESAKKVWQEKIKSRIHS